MFLHQLSKTETHTASCQPSGEITENRAEDISAAAPCRNRKKRTRSVPLQQPAVPTAKEPTANRFLKALCEKDAVLDFYAASTCLAKAQTMRYVVTGPSSEGDYAFETVTCLYDSGLSLTGRESRSTSHRSHAVFFPLFSRSRPFSSFHISENENPRIDKSSPRFLQ